MTTTDTRRGPDRVVPRLVGDEPGLLAHPGPHQWVFRVGAYEDLPRLIGLTGATRIAVLHGKIGWGKARVFLPDVDSLARDVIDIPFAGECCPEEIERVRDILVRADVHALLAIGGGKVLDTAKAAGLRAGDVPVVLAPTLASNCSAWACLSVLYEADGTPIGHEIHPGAAHTVVVEPRVLLDSPPAFLLAGIADTLAKWYECAGNLTAAPGWDLCAGLARHAALQCRDLLAAHAEAAMADIRAGVLTESLLTVFQVNIATAGLVGAFGGAFGRATAAHAIHDGLSVLPSLHGALHGTKVAYGTLVQLVLEDRWEEVAELDGLHDRLGLPHTLAELGCVEPFEEAVATIARVATLPGKTIHDLPTPVGAADVARAVRRLEEHESLRSRG